MVKLISALCALALLASACGSSSDPASPDADTAVDTLDDPTTEETDDEPVGTDVAPEPEPVDLPVDDEVVLAVNGVELTGAQLAEELADWELTFDADAPAPVRAGEGFTPDFVAFVLTQHVQLEVVGQAATRLGLTADADALASAAEALAGQLPDLPIDGVVYDQILQVQALLIALEPTPEAVADYFELNPDQFPPVLCSRHILLTTADDAEATLARLADGEDFAAVAIEESTGPSGPSGGDLGCVPEGAFVPEFEAAAYAAEPGEVVGPVETQFGFHVIEVISIGPPVLADVEAQIASDLAAAATAPLTDAISAAAVEVDAAFGSWDPATGQIALAG